MLMARPKGLAKVVLLLVGRGKLSTEVIGQELNVEPVSGPEGPLHGLHFRLLANTFGVGP